MNPADKFTSRLDKVVRHGNNFTACCPAHQDKSPSLSIRELDDGRLLLHCFAGCQALDIVQAVGLELSDLFPPDSKKDINSYNNSPFALKKTDATFDDWFIAVVEADIKAGKPIPEKDKKRYLQIIQKSKRAA